MYKKISIALAAGLLMTGISAASATEMKQSFNKIGQRHAVYSQHKLYNMVPQHNVYSGHKSTTPAKANSMHAAAPAAAWHNVE